MKRKIIHLSDEELRAALNNYVEDSGLKYAAMIDGEWGSGKTHFIKEYCAQKNGKLDNGKIKAIYISLYSLSSVNELRQGIYGAVAKQYVVGKKLVSDTIANLFSKTSKKLLDKSLVDMLFYGNELADYIFVLDDLERSSISINEVLGFINNLTETIGAKVIVVANEKEINFVDIHQNQELKYLVAALPNLSYRISQGNPSVLTLENRQKEPDSNKKILIEDTGNALSEKAERIFSDRKIYKLMREKTIGCIFYYLPSLEKTVSDIIADTLYELDEPRRGMVEKQSLAIMGSERYNNIRALKKALEFIRPFIKFYEEKRPEISSSSIIVEAVCKAAIHISIDHSKGILSNTWRDGLEYQQGHTLLWLTSSYTTFKFIEDFFLFGVFDEQRMLEVTDAFRESRMDLGENDPYTILSNESYTLPDPVISGMLGALHEELTQQKYPLGLLKSVLSTCCFFENIGFRKEAHVNENLLLAKSQIINSKEDISRYTFSGSSSISLEDNARKRFEHCENEMEAALKEQQQKLKERVLLGSFDSGTWGSQLTSLYFESFDGKAPDAEFLELISKLDLITLINVGTTKQFTVFNKLIYRCTSEDRGRLVTEAGKKAIEGITRILEGAELNERMKEYNKMYLLKSLAETVQKFDKELARGKADI
ncbi:MAG: P-loop NTPase fold protein [Raoultibacter sp.]